MAWWDSGLKAQLSMVRIIAYMYFVVEGNIIYSIFYRMVRLCVGIYLLICWHTRGTHIDLIFLKIYKSTLTILWKKIN
jgi:hypothetical protein